MKKLTFITLVLLLSVNISAHNNEKCSEHKFLGIWEGILNVSDSELRIVFKISEEKCGRFTASMDSPDQGVTDIPVNKITFEDNFIHLYVESINGEFYGELKENKNIIKGQWKQSGYSFPVELKKTEGYTGIERPQEPEKPFPYDEEEVTFENKEDSIKLSGTLTIPRNTESYPVVILISGSGQQDRNETVFGHRPFLVLSDYLTRNGITVLRYDDRGVGGSTGNVENTTTEDYAEDAIAAFRYLKNRSDLDTDNIGLIGHSEGGVIASMIAGDYENVAFIVLLSSTALPGEEILISQTRLISKVEGLNKEEIEKNLNTNRRIYNVIKEEKDNTAAEERIKNILKEESTDSLSEKYIGSMVKQIVSNWFRFFLTYDPRDALKRVKCPVLALNGEKDLQVSADENLSAIEDALREGGNKDYKIEKLTGLNHLFQTAETGSPSEYAKIEETISPVVLKIISDWITEHYRKND